MEWISIKDRLPEAGKDVLVYWPHWSSRPVIGCYLSYGKWQSSRALSDGPDPTYWMALPDIPAEM
jgi:hypothetical protein